MSYLQQLRNPILPVLTSPLRNEPHIFPFPSVAEASALQKLQHVETTSGRPCTRRGSRSSRWASEREEVHTVSDKDRACQPAGKDRRHAHGGWLIRACEMGSPGRIKLHPGLQRAAYGAYVSMRTENNNCGRWPLRRKYSRTSYRSHPHHHIQ